MHLERFETKLSMFSIVFILTYRTAFLLTNRTFRCMFLCWQSYQLSSFVWNIILNKNNHLNESHIKQVENYLLYFLVLNATESWQPSFIIDFYLLIFFFFLTPYKFFMNNFA